MEVTITIVEFYAFGQKTNKVYVDATEDFIKDDLRHICNSNLVTSISKYRATHLETVNYGGELKP